MDELNNTYTPEEVFDRKDAEETVSKKKLIAKGLLLSSCFIVILMGIIFLISLLYGENGAFTVRVADPDSIKAISLSETAGFANPTVRLSGIPIKGMDNITYTDLSLRELDGTDGSHNGKNNIAYTFYIRNQDDEPIDYNVSLDIVKATRGVQKAVRVMIIRDGVPTVYAAAAADGGKEVFPESTVSFASENKVFTETFENVKPGDIKKYTVVMWLEGEDPECVDNILRGIMKAEINVNKIPEKN